MCFVCPYGLVEKKTRNDNLQGQIEHSRSTKNFAYFLLAFRDRNGHVWSHFFVLVYFVFVLIHLDALLALIFDVYLGLNVSNFFFCLNKRRYSLFDGNNVFQTNLRMFAANIEKPRRNHIKLKIIIGIQQVAKQQFVFAHEISFNTQTNWDE